MRKYLLLFLLLLTCAITAKPQVVRGKFVGIETGDYQHLMMKDLKGQERSFFIGPDKSFDPFLHKPAQFKGRLIEVEWEKKEADIPEAGGKMTIEQATRIRLLRR